MTDPTGVRLPTPPGSRKVPPQPDVPRLAPEDEERLAPADERHAQAYDAIEDARALVTAFREDVEAGAVKIALLVTDTAVRRMRKV